MLAHLVFGAPDREALRPVFNQEGADVFALLCRFVGNRPDHKYTGVFGAGDKTARIVPNKVFQCLAAQRPVLTADTPAARALLWRDGLQGAQLAPAGDAEAVAAAILQLYQSPERCQQLAEAGFALYQRYYSSSQVGQMLVRLLSAVTTDLTSQRWSTSR